MRLTWCLLILLVGLVPINVTEDEPKKPNIILILADDLGFSDLGCYGSEIKTPNLDRLAANGIRFTQFYNTPRCCPTRASLLTGLYPHQAGVGLLNKDLGKPGYQGGLNNRCVTIAELLRQWFYRTFLIGKWHVTNSKDGKETWPLQRGFDKFFGLIGSVRSYYDPPTLTRDNTPIEAGQGFYLTDAITENAIAYLQEASKSKEPFFLYVAHTAPHWPLHALPADIAKYRGKYLDGWDALRKARYQRQIDLGLIDARWKLSPRDVDAPAWDKVENKDWEDLRMAVYAAQIERMDQGIGRLLQALKESGQEENTLILFLADNGGNAEEILPSWRGDMFPEKTRDGRPTRVGNVPSANPGPDDVFQSNGLPWGNASNTPFRLFKHWTHQGGIATPLIAYWPAVIKKASITDQPGHVIDLLPTLVEVAGGKYPDKFPGRDLLPVEGKSLLPILLGKERAGHEAIFWEHEGNRAIRQSKWKLVAEHGRPWELYDLDVDRTELNDLAAQNPEQVKELSNRYEQWANRVGVIPWDDINPEKKKR